MATDNHVGYEERDPIRKDDSWKTFDEILTIAKEREVRSWRPVVLVVTFSLTVFPGRHGLARW